MESLVAVVISLHAGSLRQLASLYCIGGSSRVQQPSEWPSSSLQACSALYHRMRGLENSLTSSWLAYHSWQGVFQIWEMIKNEVAHTRNRECQAREAYCSSDQDKHQHRQEEGGTICDEDVIFTPEPENLTIIRDLTLTTTNTEKVEDKFYEEPSFLISTAQSKNLIILGQSNTRHHRSQSIHTK